MERYVGATVSASGGLAKAIERGEALKVNSIQTMFSTPMRWSTKDIDEEQIEAMAVATAESEVKKLLFHGVYLINLARKDRQKFHLSKLSVQTHLDAARKLAASLKSHGSDAEVLGMTFHPGSAIDLDTEDGIKRVAEGLNWVLEKVPDANLLLECSAGAGNVLGDKLEELDAMRQLVDNKFKSQVGYVLDTQHMYVSGYDWKNDVEGVVEQVDAILGLEHVKAIHLNDSKTAFASNKDRHANLGEGEIGIEALTSIINHDKLKHIPMTLETPAMKSPEETQPEVEKLKKLAK